MMIPPSRLQEFGFSDPSQFPQLLKHHEVTLSLPQAAQRGVAPLSVVVDHGLAVPVAGADTFSGMIIRSDGAILHVGHRDPDDTSSALEARYIHEVPFDVRAMVASIMRRAVEADPALRELWGMITRCWRASFPVPQDLRSLALGGEYPDPRLAWEALEKLMETMIGQLLAKVPAAGSTRLRVLLQTASEFDKGWEGEEILVDEALWRTGFQGELYLYLKGELLSKMRAVLANPMFYPGSTFRLYYGARPLPAVKLVAVPPPQASVPVADRVGIDLTVK